MFILAFGAIIALLDQVLAVPLKIMAGPFLYDLLGKGKYLWVQLINLV
jgi:hypothetical protein